MSDHVREILTEIATRPAPQWQALLTRRFPADPMLVQQAMLWLHADQQHVDDKEDRPSLGAVGDTRYELAVRLDSGATAAVWQAYDRKLGRAVAIKILHDHNEPSAVAQILAEARAACDVISDHVVRILDVHDGEARPCIVMELVAEHDPDREQLVLGTAASACRPRDIDEAVRWVMGVARGVHDAHLRNVFHRDLKPDNVLITPISRRARIADFGLAVSAANVDADPSATALVRRRPSGPVSVSGTPEYMAPEQASGLPPRLDPRSGDDRAVLVAVDVWGLGALAYDLLSGSPPWRSPPGVEPWELACSGARPPALERTPDGKRIPRRLRRIVEKAMSPDARARYETAAQVANELEAFLTRHPITFDRSRAVRAWLWSRRNPQLTLTGLVAVALVLLTLGTRSTVTRLRGERNGLLGEVAGQQAELDKLTHNVDEARGELGATEQRLAVGGSDLAKLEASIRDERKVYESVLREKESALQEATVETRRLVDELETAHREQGAATEQRSLYERYWTDARTEADQATKDRDRVRRERDSLRLERDTLQKERDLAGDDRDEARREVTRLKQEIANGNPPPKP